MTLSALAKQQAVGRASCDDATIRRGRICEVDLDNTVGDTSERHVPAPRARTRAGISGLVRVR